MNILFYIPRVYIANLPVAISSAAQIAFIFVMKP